MLQNQTAYADAVEARLQVRLPLTAGPHAIGATFAGRAEVENTRRLQAILRTTSDTSETLIGPPHVLTITVTGPFNSDRPGRHAEPPRDLHLPSGDAGPGRAVRPHDPVDPRPPRLSRHADAGGRQRADGPLPGMAPRRQLRLGHRVRPAAHPLRTQVPGPDRASAGVAAGHRLPRDRPRAGLAPVVLPVEQPARRPAPGSGGSQSALPAVRARPAGHADAGRSPVAGLGRQLRRPVAAAAQPAQRGARIPASSRTSTTSCGRRSAARRSCSSTASSARIASVLELLTADYTFVNERLAKHYGIPHVYGNHFRRVPVTADARRGILGHGSILTVTSHADRTSPVVRGKWILDNLLGTPPPPPPPVVPAAAGALGAGAPDDDARADGAAPRQPGSAPAATRPWIRLASRSRTSTPSGAWRVRDDRAPIDASGVFVDGSAIDGPVALRQALLARPQAIVGNLTEKMLIYGLGRGIDYRDMPTVRAIVRDAAAQDYRFSSLVLGIVRSDAFQKRIVAVDTRTGLRSSQPCSSPGCSLPRRTFLRGRGRHHRAAVPRRHGAGVDAATEGGVGAAPRRVHLLLERHGDRALDAGHHRQGRRLPDHPQAVRAAPLVGGRASRASATRSRARIPPPRPAG